jgi:hypothetical protein
MKKQFVFTTIILVLLSCNNKKEKEKPETEAFFPVLSFIKSQVAHIDTSLYSIKKIVYIDSLHSDTSFIHRENFRALAKEFLELPDLSEKKYKKRYKEESNFDETMGRVILSYTALNPGKEDIQSEQVLIKPDAGMGDKITSIIINKATSTRDGYFGQNMLWQADQYFQVTTTVQKPGQPEIFTITKVTWNEPEAE